MNIALFDTLTPAQQADMDARNADQDPATVGPWAAELHDSDRPKDLITLLLLLVARLGSAARRVSVSIPHDARGMSAAVATERAIEAALSVFEAHADAILGNVVPRAVDALRSYVQDVTGADLATSGISEQLLRDIAARIAANQTDVRTAALRAVADWHANGGTDIAALRDAVQQELDQLDWRVARTARTAMQDAYIELLRTGFRQARTAKVRREAMPNACDWCRAAAGVYEADDPDCYATHPNCADVWSPAPDDASVDFAATAAVSGPAYRLDGRPLVYGPVYVLAVTR